VLCETDILLAIVFNHVKYDIIICNFVVYCCIIISVLGHFYVFAAVNENVLFCFSYFCCLYFGYFIYVVFFFYKCILSGLFFIFVQCLQIHFSKSTYV